MNEKSENGAKKLQDIHFDYYEKGVLIHGKALLLTTVDIQKLGRESFESEAKRIIDTIAQARLLGYKAIILITNLEEAAIPLRIKTLLTEKKNCWMCYL